MTIKYYRVDTSTHKVVPRDATDTMAMQSTLLCADAQREWTKLFDAAPEHPDVLTEDAELPVWTKALATMVCAYLGCDEKAEDQVAAIVGQGLIDLSSKKSPYIFGLVKGLENAHKALLDIAWSRQPHEKGTPREEKYERWALKSSMATYKVIREFELSLESADGTP